MKKFVNFLKFSYFFQINFQIIIYLIKILGGLAPPQTEGGKILGGR